MGRIRQRQAIRTLKGKKRECPKKEEWLACDQSPGQRPRKLCPEEQKSPRHVLTQILLAVRSLISTIKTFSPNIPRSGHVFISIQSPGRAKQTSHQPSSMPSLSFSCDSLQTLWHRESDLCGENKEAKRIQAEPGI